MNKPLPSGQAGRTLVAGDVREAKATAAYRTMMRRAYEILEGDASDVGDAMDWPEVTVTGSGEWSDLVRPDLSEVHQRALTALAEPLAPLVHVPETVAAPRPGPLEGLPLVVKDLVDVAGMPTRNGTPGGAWREPRASAAAWERLAAAGAVCVGKAATHEMGWGATTPAVAHPLDPERLTGGSSGGSAAAVCAGVVPAALGTDTSGSIGIPAALCGVVGLRPTHGSLPLAGVTPLAPRQDTVGLLTRDVALCLRLFGLLAARPLQPPVPDIHGLRIGVLEAVGRIQPAVADQVERAVNTLAAAGAKPVRVRLGGR